MQSMIRPKGAKGRRGDPRRRRWQPLRRLGLLALIPFLLLSTIMPGTMLARDAHGGLTVVLCIEGGAVEMVVGPDGARTNKAPGDDHPTCHWAPHAQQILASGAVGMAPPVPLLLAPAYSRDMPEALRRAEILAPQARGPPAFV